MLVLAALTVALSAPAATVHLQAKRLAQLPACRLRCPLTFALTEA
jgi:hypothetical protein